MKLLIIGSKGFIGSHATSFFSKNNEVWQCDVVVDYTNTKYFQIDATNADYNDIFRLNEFDICINCSGAASVPDSIVNPQRDFTLNTVNVFKQLDAIRKYNPKCRYINLSSAAVYGNPNYLPIDVKHPTLPISPYGVHKKMAEEISKSFFENFDLRTCNLRIFSAYGEGLKKQLFWDLYQKGLSGKTIELYGTGNESRDFIHVQDVVNVINLVIKKSSFENEIINVSNGKELTIRKVANLFYENFQNQVDVVFKGNIRIGDPTNWVGDISRLKELGYTKSVDIETGLKSYIKWIKENE